MELGDEGKTVLGREPTDGKSLVAIDLGAESCRISLLRWIDSAPQIQVVHRFSNSPINGSEGLRWNLRKIQEGVQEGLRLCAELASEGIAAVGVDGWAVDYVRLAQDGTPASDPYCYRDDRTLQSQKQVHARISPERLYELTGIQILSINTLYQLFADNFDHTPQTTRWTNLPEYVLSWLGGQRVSEYTNATHTQLIGAADRQWCEEIFGRTGLDSSAAPPLVQPGAQIGAVNEVLAKLPAFRDAKLIAPACHDTASAIAGIPALGDDWAFISSGTWSLIGTVLDAPCICESAREKNFSNEGGVGGKINFLKNVNGMWLLQQCIEQWRSEGTMWTIAALIESCAGLPDPDDLLDVDDPEFIPPGNMPARINAQLVRNGKAAISDNAGSAPQMANLILHSLACRYSAVLRDLQTVTGKRFKRLYIVGGGSKNWLLNRLTADATGLEVVLGSTESTTVGNFAIQLASLAGDCTVATGVKAAAVAEWASLLSRARVTDEADRELSKARR